MSGDTGTQGIQGEIGPSGGEQGIQGIRGIQGEKGNSTTINEGDITIAKTNGLKEALDSTALLDSINTFKAN
jgi:hypothetical protein